MARRRRQVAYLALTTLGTVAPAGCEGVGANSREASSASLEAQLRDELQHDLGAIDTLTGSIAPSAMLDVRLAEQGVDAGQLWLGRRRRRLAASPAEAAWSAGRFQPPPGGGVGSAEGILLQEGVLLPGPGATAPWLQPAQTPATAPTSFLLSKPRLPAVALELTAEAPVAGSGECKPPCEDDQGVCVAGICLCASPYIGNSCEFIDPDQTSGIWQVPQHFAHWMQNYKWAYLGNTHVPKWIAVPFWVIMMGLAAFLAALCYRFFPEAKEVQARGEVTDQEDDALRHEAWIRKEKGR